MKCTNIYVLLIDGEHVQAFVSKGAALTHAVGYLNSWFVASDDADLPDNTVCQFSDAEGHQVAIERMRLIRGAPIRMRSIKELKQYANKEDTTTE